MKVYIKKSKWTECKKLIIFFYRKEYYKLVLKMYQKFDKKVFF